MAVFAGSRIRENNVLGTTTDNPLLVGATTMNSAGLTNLPAVASNHAVLILDPLRAAGAPEIVIVTAHTAAATSATITRGAYGTTARQHASGTLWVHAETKDDLIRIVTSGTRPADQYEGQLIYETDTDRFVGFDGAAWARTTWLTATGRTGWRGRRVANQSISNTTETAVLWDTEDFDSDGFLTPPSGGFLVPAGLGGIYAINTTIVAAVALGTGRAFINMARNGTTPTVHRYPFGVSEDTSAAQAVIILAAGDTVNINVFHTQGGAVNFTAGIEIWRIGA